MCQAGARSVDDRLPQGQTDAANELALAATALGVAYQEGDGVEQSLEEAAQWYMRGLQGGDEAAAERLSELLPELRRCSKTDGDQAGELLRRAESLGFRID